LRIAFIGVVQLPIDDIVTNPGAERAFNMGNLAAKVDRGASPGNLIHGKAMACQPACYRTDVFVGRAEPHAKLLGSKPAVIVGGSRVLLLREQSFQIRLPVGGKMQGKDHPRHRQCLVGSSAVELRPGLRMDISPYGYRVVVVDNPLVTRKDGIGMARCQDGQQQDSKNGPFEHTIPLGTTKRLHSATVQVLPNRCYMFVIENFTITGQQRYRKSSSQRNNNPVSRI